MVREATLAAIGRWGVLLPPALVLALAGLGKFLQAESWRGMFLDWGYPAWMSPVTGVLEMVAGVAMFVPVTRFYGGALGTLVMLGAAVTRLVNGEYPEAVAPVIVAGLAGLTAWWARPEWVEALLHRGTPDA